MTETQRDLFKKMLPVGILGIASVCLIGVFVYMPPAKKEAALQETAPKSAEYSPLEIKAAVEDYIDARTKLGYYCGAVTQIVCPDKTTSLERSKCIELNIKFDSAVKRAGEAEKKLEEITGEHYSVKMPDCLKRLRD